MIHPIIRIIIPALWLLAACERPFAPGTLVPATVTDDPNLPQTTITVRGRERRVHYRTFGDKDRPALFILHGSLSDMRAYLPLRVLADTYYVVFWDLRGNGLSERVTADELSFDAMAVGIKAMKEKFSPDKRVTLMGHSWSAVFVAKYIGTHPDDVKQAVLMEPPGLTSTAMEKAGSALNLGTEAYLDMTYSSEILTPQDHERLDYKMLGMLKSSVRNFHCDPDNPPPWPVWRVGGYALIVWENAVIKDGQWDYDFSGGLDTFPRKVLFVGTSCSPIGYDFQEKHNAPYFKNFGVLKIEKCGHRIVTERFDALVAGLKEYLAEYRE
jgi:proline iminopeptidase